MPDYDVGRIVAAFEHAGASAISVLTNEDDFGGQVEDLLLARRACSLPLLRKDFLLDEEEMAESRAGGADCVLLIARIHGESRLKEMCAAAHEQGLQVLLELYSDSELEGALRAQPDLLGINQRNLDTLEIDDAIFQRVAPLVPEGLPLVAESGVGTRGQMLAAALSERRFDPAVSQPGLLLADALTPPASKPAQALARACAELDYVHAWAVIWAVQWHWDNVEEIKKGEPWWEFDYRRAHAKPYASRSPGE